MLKPWQPGSIQGREGFWGGDVVFQVMFPSDPPLLTRMYHLTAHLAAN